MTDMRKIDRVKPTVKRTPLYPSLRRANEVAQRLTTLLRETPLYAPLRRINENAELARWVRSGRPSPPPHVVKRLEIAKQAERFGTDILVETGTYLGQMVQAMRNQFSTIYSIEVDDKLFARAKKKFSRYPHVVIMHGDSGQILADVVPSLDQVCLFWLDGHYSAGITSMGETPTPVVSELEHIAVSPIDGHVILIDDARLFDGGRGYPTLGFIEDLVRTRMLSHRMEVSDDIIRIVPTNR